MRARWFAAAAACLALTTWALLQTAAVAADTPRRDPVIETLALRAAASPPEFAADVLLRLAASPRVTDPEWKRELIDEAFLRALSVQEPYRRGAILAPPDSQQAALTLAYDARIDRVGLQARAARAMASVSAARAREMFEWIDFELAPPSCEDALVPILDDYYDTLAVLVGTTFERSVDGRAEALRYFVLYLWRASRPSEMAALTRAVLRYKPAAEESLYLETVLSWILDYGIRDARGFSAAGPELVSRVAEIDDRSRALGTGSGVLLRGLRRYLVAQLKSGRCIDSLEEERALAAFNRLATLRAANVIELPPIGAAESRPARTLAAATYDRLWRTSESYRLRERALALWGTDRKPGPESAKRTRDWQDEAGNLLTDIDQWPGLREPAERDYLFEKAVLLTGLAEIAPATPAGRRAVRDAVAFLRYSEPRDRRTLWFAHLTRTLGLARGSERRRVLESLEASGDLVLGLYASLARLQARR